MPFDLLCSLFVEGNGSFNRGMLMNVGVREALKQHTFDCLVLHDVDLLPENDRNLYTCSNSPRHMSVALSTYDYRWGPAFTCAAVTMKPLTPAGTHELHLLNTDSLSVCVCVCVCVCEARRQGILICHIPVRTPSRCAHSVGHDFIISLLNFALW